MKFFTLIALMALSTGAFAAKTQTITCKGSYEDYGYSEEVKVNVTIVNEKANVFFDARSARGGASDLEVLSNSRSASISDYSFNFNFDPKALKNKNLKKFNASVSWISFFNGETTYLTCSSTLK